MLHILWTHKRVFPVLMNCLYLWPYIIMEMEMKISTQKNNKENAPAYLLAKLVRSIGRRLSQRIRQLFLVSFYRWNIFVQKIDSNSIPFQQKILFFLFCFWMFRSSQFIFGTFFTLNLFQFIPTYLSTYLPIYLPS